MKTNLLGNCYKSIGSRSSSEVGRERDQVGDAKQKIFKFALVIDKFNKFTHQLFVFVTTLNEQHLPRKYSLWKFHIVQVILFFQWNFYYSSFRRTNRRYDREQRPVSKMRCRQHDWEFAFTSTDELSQPQFLPCYGKIII